MVELAFCSYLLSTSPDLTSHEGTEAQRLEDSSPIGTQELTPSELREVGKERRLERQTGQVHTKKGCRGLSQQHLHVCRGKCGPGRVEPGSKLRKCTNCIFLPGHHASRAPHTALKPLISLTTSVRAFDPLVCGTDSELGNPRLSRS